MSLALRVCGPRVLIQPDIDEQVVVQTESGLMLAQTLEAAVEGHDAREAWYSGIVIAVGDHHALFDVRPLLRRKVRDLLECGTYADVMRAVDALVTALDEMPETRERGFTVGDRVTFSATAGQEITIDDVTYLIMQEADILGVLESEGAVA